MATLTYPGVYVQEVSSGVRPIQAAGTSTAAFIGVAEKGPLGEPTKVTNFTEYQTLFGGFLQGVYLTHAVYQFFNNGGTQCYVVRVSGANTETATIVLNDRGAAAQASLTIAARSPGRWGNSLAVVVSDGVLDSGNEFNLAVYWQEEPAPLLLETFANLSMTPGAPNYVKTATAASKYIQVTPNGGNTNADAGASRGALAPLSLAGTGRTRFRINVNGDGYQEVNLLEAVGAGAGQVADLTTAANLAGAIQFVVRKLPKLRASTDQQAFTKFECKVDGGVLVLTSGVKSVTSAVNVTAAGNSAQDASGLLKLGKLNGGVETAGAAITRPVNSTPTAAFYYVGDHDPIGGGVASIVAGSDGDTITNDAPYLAVFSTGVLDAIDDVSLIAVPGIGSSAVVGAGINYCANRSLSDCFFIGDMGQDDDTPNEAKTFRSAITPKNSYGAVYMPWLLMSDPTGVSTEPIAAPPSGFMAGIYAKTDALRGVWKAPAGATIPIAGAVGLQAELSDVQQGDLNPINVNVIRRFAAAGIVPWGARTVTADPEWGYIPVRRMAILLRVSIYNGIQWAVFEPNDEPLWSSLRLNITSFMMTLYRQGAFQGSSPAEAFFVKCDSETTTQDDINLGIVNVLIGFAPLKPAEFVVVRIRQQAGQPA